MLETSGAKVLFLPPKSPNLNPHIQRFIRSMKFECPNRMIFFGEKSMRKALTDFTAHYHEERNRQGLDIIITPVQEVARAEGNIHQRERLGGMLSYYYREAA